MKKLSLLLIAMALSATGAFAASEGTDTAANYGGSWTNGSNGRTAGAASPAIFLAVPLMAPATSTPLGFPFVPEPSSFALLAGPVLLGAWFFVRRRRQA